MTKYRSYNGLNSNGNKDRHKTKQQRIARQVFWIRLERALLSLPPQKNPSSLFLSLPISAPTNRRPPDMPTIPFPSSISPAPVPAKQVHNGRTSLVRRTGCFRNRRFDARKMDGSPDSVTCSVSRDGGNPVELGVRFPRDYSELLDQAKAATELALQDNKQLLEIEFPTAGLESVPGDGEGGIEMTESLQLIREFCDRLISPEKATRTRIFFPEANEVDFARQLAFGGSSLKLDYLTKPSLFEDFGFVSKVKMADHVKPDDELFLVAYPYFNVNEMLVVEELYTEAVVNTARKLIIFNGELDRIRSGYYPPFFYPKLAALCKTFLPKLETVYYVHNFKGRNGGILFRSYPGPWKVLRRVGGQYLCLHQQEEMPSLKEVALDILPSA